VTDDEVAHLRELYGDPKTVALVLLLAYANFQDRLLLGLGAKVEPGGPYPPLDIRFAKDDHPAAPERPNPLPRVAARDSGFLNDPEWTSLDAAELQKAMAEQRSRPPRIPVPIWEEVRKVLGEKGGADRPPLRIKWSLTCLGYQAELATAWSACLRAFAEDARQDRVFEESLFWVITLSLH